MFKGQRVLSIIPARERSKGLPNKNFIELGGKPLIYWTIKSSLNCKFIDDSLITSDSDQILDFAKQFDVLLKKRPVEFSGDNISMVEVLFNLFEMEPKLKEEYTYFTLLQPTSPLRTEKHICDSFSQLEKNKIADSLISVTKVDNGSLKNLVLGESGYIEEIDTKGYFSMNRQQLPLVLKPNGAIYTMKVHEFLSAGKLISNRTIPFEMKIEDSHDIDTLEDYRLVSNLFKLT